MLRDCDASLRSAAAGIRCWGRSCDVTARPHIPPAEEGLLARSSFFGAGRSFKIYVAHLEEACLLLEVGASWNSKAVTVADYGLAGAGERSFSPRPAISKSQLRELLKEGAAWRFSLG